MERLTYWNEEYGCWSYRGPSGDAAVRLAAIENILGDEYDLDHLRELAQAENDGRLVVLQDGVTKQGLQEEYCKAKHMADDQLPSPDYTTGRIAGFGTGQVSVLEKILTREEAEAALKDGDKE